MTGVVVTNQYPTATFSSTTGHVNYVTTQPQYNGSKPNFLCSGPLGGAIDCLEETIIDFTNPVSGLTFNGLGINNNNGTVADIDVFDARGLLATVPVMAHGGLNNPELQDLSAYSNISRIRIYNITDPGGIGWDDFIFTPNGRGADADGNGIPDALEQRLAEQYAPTLLFHANEPNMPVDVNWMLSHAGSLDFFEKCFPVDTRLVAVSPLTTQDQLLHTVLTHSTCGNGIPNIGSTTPNPDSQQFGGSNADTRAAFYLPNVADNNQVG